MTDHDKLCIWYAVLFTLVFTWGISPPWVVEKFLDTIGVF